jgi:hypothetical protein
VRLFVRNDAHRASVLSFTPESERSRGVAVGMSRAPIDIRSLRHAGDPGVRRRAVPLPGRGAGRRDVDEQSGANVATKEKVAEIAADVMTTFYHVNVGALETQKFRTTPLPSGFAFSDTIKGPLRQLFFVVLLPDGTVVEPRVEKRL